MTVVLTSTLVGRDEAFHDPLLFRRGNAPVEQLAGKRL